MDKDDSIESSLVKTIANSELAELTTDAVDAALDDLPIPVFSTLRKFYRGIRSVQNYFYVKKVIRFLLCLKDIPTDKRREQLENLRVVPGELEKFGEHIVLVLDRLNDVNKADLMGKVTRAFMDGEIKFEQLKSLNYAIDAIDIRLLPTLDSLIGDFYGHGVPIDDKQALANAGLMSIDLSVDMAKINVASIGEGNSVFTSQPTDHVKSVSLKFFPNELAKLLVKICLSKVRKE